MKKPFLFMMLFMTTVAIAQPPRGGSSDRKQSRERIHAMAVAYITDELELTTEEAQRFWPIYNEMSDNREKLERKKRKLIKEMQAAYETMTDGQAQVYVKRLKAVEKEISLAGYENASDEIIAIIGAKRFLKLTKAREEFRRKMIKEFKKRGQRRN